MKLRMIGCCLALAAAPLSGAGAQGAPSNADGSPASLAPMASQLTYTQVLLPEAMRRVQERLAALGAFTGSADGNWGTDSQAALKNFQQNSGLQATGQLNQATAITLGLNPADLVISHPAAVVAAPNPPAPPPPAPQAASPSSPPAPPPVPHAPFALSTDSVRLVQSRLHQLGFYSGYVDGVWGAGTQIGMQSFQRSRSLPVTDGLNAPTVTAMGLDPDSMTPR